ncbi:MAG: dehydrogenase [Prevotella sp.]|nr:dehydrogenase [Prevotella sp.]
MADGFLETHQQQYEARKEAWLRKKRHLPKTALRVLQRPDDEAL